MGAPKDPIKYKEWKEKLSKGRTGKPAWNKGIPTPDHIKKKQSDVKIGEKNPMYGVRGENCYQWKGDNVSYRELHNWLRKYKPIPKHCEECGKERKLDCANISGEYKRDPADYKYICRSCHWKKDGTIYNIIKMREKA